MLPPDLAVPAVTPRENGPRDWIGSTLVAACFLLIAFRHAWLSTRHLQWPFDIDLFRDSAFAHSVMAGKFPEDAYYLGEKNWYNPFSAFLVAAIASLFSTDPIQVHARLGAFVGLGVPVAIFLLGVVLFGRWAAVGAIFAFLFLRPEIPTCYTPTYSPWLYANALALMPLAACIGLALWARRTARLFPWALCGAALGVTFLAHTAAAVVAGCVAVAVGFTRDWLSAWRRYAVLLVTAFVVSLPFAVTILLHYKLRIRNGAGQAWLWEETELSHLSSLLRGSLTIANGVAAWGGVVLLRKPWMVGPRRVIFTWLGVAGTWLAYSFFRQVVPAWPLPSFVPPFHWLFHLRVVRALLFGFGLYSGLVMIAEAARPWIRIPAPATLCAVLFVLLGWNYAHYVELFDFPAEAAAARGYSELPGFAGTVSWLRTNTPADAVILADPVNSVVMVGAAYRHAVSLDPNFSNPYVPLEERAQAADVMSTALARADEPGFRAAASQYHVGFILLADIASPGDPRLATPFAKICFTAGTYAILRVE